MQRRSFPSLRSAALAWACLCAAGAAHAITAPGYVVSEIALPDFAQGDVVAAGDALFVGVGPGFSGAAQAVVRIDAGGITVVADGFNSLSGFAYDAANDRLLVGDNGQEALGSETGDTLYAIANALAHAGTPQRAADLAVAAAGSIPGVADIVLDPNDPGRAFVSDASSSFPPAGRVVAVDLASGALSVLQTGLGFAAGLAASDDTLFIGDLNGLSFTGEISSVALPAANGPRTPIASGLAGQYDVELEAGGTLLATAFSELLRIDPAIGTPSVVASGFGFATGLFERDGTIWVLDGGFPGVATVYLLAPIPEPATALLVAAGVALLGARRRGAVR
jgi:hypothetical protein